MKSSVKEEKPGEERKVQGQRKCTESRSHKSPAGTAAEGWSWGGEGKGGRGRGRMYTYNKGLILSQICSSRQKKHAVTAPEDDNVHLRNAADLSSLQRK